MIIICLSIILLGILLLFYENILITKDLKIHFRIFTSISYIALIVGFLGLIYLSVFSATTVNYVKLEIPNNLPDLINSLSKMLWPISALTAFLTLRNPILKLIQNSKWEISGKTIRYLGQLENSKDQFEEVIKNLSEQQKNEPDFVQDFAKKIHDALIQSLPQDPQKREAHLISALALTFFREQFEIIYRLIFGSQIKALEYLTQGPGDLTGHYENHLSSLTEKEIEAFKPNIEQWQNFLIHHKLIIIEKKLATITSTGKGFLDYIEARNYNVDKAN